MIKLFNVLFPVVLVCSSLLVADIVSADESVRVHVRMLRADEKSMIGFKSFVTNTSSSKIDPDLVDLKEKLESLPFERFTLVNSTEKVIPLKKRACMQFPGGQMLHLRPLSIDGNQVSLWLNWEDGNGQTILDTRMHFDSTQGVLAGTDSTDNTGLLLAINVKPGN